MELNGATVLIYNKKYEHAKIAQWGTSGRSVGTYEPSVNPDQLWILEESSKHPGYYYIKNAKYSTFRLVKWGSRNNHTGVSDKAYNDDQLWTFRKEEGEYYRIYNKVYPSAKITKWGPGDGDWGTYDGPDYSDQLWKLVPRYKATALENVVWSCDNRQGSVEVTEEVEVTTGLKLTNSGSLTIEAGFKDSLKASLSLGIEGLVTAGVESALTFFMQIEANVSSSNEIQEVTTNITKYTAPAHKKYRVLQTVVNFTSHLDSDNCSLYHSLRIEESD